VGGVGARLADAPCSVGGHDMVRYDRLRQHPLDATACVVQGTGAGLVPTLASCTDGVLGMAGATTGVGAEPVDGIQRCVVRFDPMTALGAQYDTELQNRTAAPQVAALQARIRAATDAVNDLTAQLAAARTDRAACEKELSDDRSQVARLEAKLADQTSQLAALQADLDQLGPQAADSKQALDRARQALDAQKKALYAQAQAAVLDAGQDDGPGLLPPSAVPQGSTTAVLSDGSTYNFDNMGANGVGAAWLYDRDITTVTYFDASGGYDRGSGLYVGTPGPPGADAQGAWFSLALDRPVVATGFNLTLRQQYLRGWALYGSASGGASWTLLDARTLDAWTAGEQEALFSFDNATPYTAYRFVITRAQDTTAPCVAEFKLWVGAAPADG
jgi:hypothetical protein